MAFVVTKTNTERNIARPASDWQTLTFNLAGEVISFDGCKGLAVERIASITQTPAIGNNITSTSVGYPERTASIEITQDMIDQIKELAFKAVSAEEAVDYDYSLLKIAPFTLTITRTVPQLDGETVKKSNTVCTGCKFNKDSLVLNQGDTESWVKFDFKPTTIKVGLLK